MPGLELSRNINVNKYRWKKEIIHCNLGNLIQLSLSLYPTYFLYIIMRKIDLFSDGEGGYKIIGIK